MQEKKQIELKLHLDKIDQGSIEKLVEQLKVQVIQADKKDGKVELRFKIDKIDQDMEKLLQHLKAYQVDWCRVRRRGGTPVEGNESKENLQGEPVSRKLFTSYC